MKVLIIDDHPVVRAGLTAVLGTQADMEIVAQAADGHSGILAAEQYRPDVVTMDMHLPDIPGPTAIQQILEQAAATNDAWRPQIIAFSVADDDESILTAIQAGACAYLPKSSTDAEIVETVRAAGTGAPVRLLPSVATALTRQMQRNVLAHPLSSREKALLQLLVDGLSTAQIAERVTLEQSTVKTHVHHIYQKLGAVNRAQAIARAHTLGLVQPRTN